MSARSLLRELALIALVVAYPVQSDFAASARASNGDGPEVAMDLTKRDFGEVFAGEDLEQPFTVRNIGTKPLELSQKSSVSSRSTPRKYVEVAVLWRPGDRYLANTGAEMRAAPS